jgi:hypothetical protein
MLPFNQESTVSAISALIYWGQHNPNKFYTDSQGNIVPVRSSKVGEIFSHEGKIHFKKKLDDNTWIDTSVEIDSIKEALNTADPLNNPGISDLVAFLADKRLNVNKQLLTDSSSMYFHPKVTKTEKGYEFGFTPYDNYQSFLIKKVLTTSAPVKENFPKFGNRMIVFKSENRVKPKISDKFVNPKEEVGPKEPKKKARATTAAQQATEATQASGSNAVANLLFGNITPEQQSQAAANFQKNVQESLQNDPNQLALLSALFSGNPAAVNSVIMGNLTSEETASKNELSSESKGSLASMFGQKQQVAPEASQSNRPKNLFNDVDTNGASITGDPKVDKTIEDQKNNCPPK